jgi:hypothetical protein
MIILVMVTAFAAGIFISLWFPPAPQIIIIHIVGPTPSQSHRSD